MLRSQAAGRGGRAIGRRRNHESADGIEHALLILLGQGTRSGFSSNGGSISTRATALPESAMRTVRVIEALDAVVAKDAGDTWPETMAPLPMEAPRELENIAPTPESRASASIA